MDFNSFYTVYVYKVKESIADRFHWATMFEWSRKSKSTSGSRGTDDSVL